MRKRLPIGMDDFRKVRQKDCYYIDKSRMIQDFIEIGDEVSLIARPRRFGKTLNMTMLREFFDITRDSRELFQGLYIMKTEYASLLNSRPVLYFTFKNCKGSTSEELTVQLKLALLEEYGRYRELLGDKLDRSRFSAIRFLEMYENLMKWDVPFIYLSSALSDIIRMVNEYYQMAPILLIDEYDQPIMSSYEGGFHEEVGNFFSNLYGAAMKGNPFLGQALLTGVQRVAKESIFFQFNNARVYTVFHNSYGDCFGITEREAEQLLKEYGLALNADVKKKYDGYLFGNTEVYNPWSLLNFADSGVLDNYWVNTSSNKLVRKALKEADRRFWDDFDRLVMGEEVPVWLTLETSYIERDSNYSLWGLLVNSGYLTIKRRIDANTFVVRIPNDEVMAEFQVLVSEIAGIEGLDLQQMFEALRGIV